MDLTSAELVLMTVYAGAVSDVAAPEPPAESARAEKAPFESVASADRTRGLALRRRVRSIWS